MQQSSNNNNENNHHRRRNGWSLPWHPYQICSWLFIAILLGLSLYSSLPLPIFPLFPIYFLICYCWLILCIIIMTTVDPGFGESSIQPQRFDSTVFQHVIENNFCHVCQLEVPIKAKHCKYCNKCVAGFDHHCKWLNNCVGNKNYKMFFVLISSITVISATVIIINSVFIYFLIAGSMTKEQPTHTNFLSAFHWKYVTSWPWLIVTVFCATFHLILFGVTAHLYRFHIMLWKNGMTTYSYIVNIRRNPNSRDTVTDIANHRIPHGRAIYDSSIVNNAISAPYNGNANNSIASSRPITPPRRLPELQRPSTTGSRIRPPPFGHIPRTLTRPHSSSKTSPAAAPPIESTANPV